MQDGQQNIVDEVEESEGTTASSAIGAVVAAADEKVLMARAWTGRLAIPRSPRCQRPLPSALIIVVAGRERAATSL